MHFGPGPKKPVSAQILHFDKILTQPVLKKSWDLKSLPKHVHKHTYKKVSGHKLMKYMSKDKYICVLKSNR